MYTYIYIHIYRQIEVENNISQNYQTNIYLRILLFCQIFWKKLKLFIFINLPIHGFFLSFFVIEGFNIIIYLLWKKFYVAKGVKARLISLFLLFNAFKEKFIGSPNQAYQNSSSLQTLRIPDQQFKARNHHAETCFHRNQAYRKHQVNR